MIASKKKPKGKELISSKLKKTITQMMKPKFKKNLEKKKCTLEELNECLSPHSNESLYMHLNILSLPYHHEKLYILLCSLKVKPKILAISESRVRRDIQPIYNISHQNYAYEHA